MSTFLGQIKEIPGISVDYFRGPENIGSNLFFLSHCHGDHMKGLDSLLFNVVNNFSKHEVFVYASELSVRILRNMFSSASKNERLRSLSFGKQHLLKNGDKDICVTLIPAGHCPGSVMFLFEAEKTILYTGDIRLTVNEIKNCKSFKMDSGNIKKIDKMYFDSTFFKEEFLKFPTREKSIEAFINSVKYNLQDTKTTIFYKMPAKYGSEFLMIETFKEIKMPFHVDPETYEIYKSIPEMDQIVTTNPEITRLHTKTKFKSCCDPRFDNTWTTHSKTYQITTTAMRWKNDDFSNGIIERETGSDCICYSSHCSLQELKDIITYLKPKKLYPCVVPEDLKEKNKMSNLINNVLTEIHGKNIEIKVNESGIESDWTLPESFEENSGEGKKRDDKIDFETSWMIPENGCGTKRWTDGETISEKEKIREKRVKVDDVNSIEIGSWILPANVEESSKKFDHGCGPKSWDVDLGETSGVSSKNSQKKHGVKTDEKSWTVENFEESNNHFVEEKDKKINVIETKTWKLPKNVEGVDTDDKIKTNKKLKTSF